MTELCETKLHQIKAATTTPKNLQPVMLERKAVTKVPTVASEKELQDILEARSNAIKQKSKIRNKYNKWRSRENYLAWQNIKKKCKYLTKKAEKRYFDKILSKGIITNK